MSNNFNDFNTKFNTEKLMIAQTDYWRWSLRPAQCTLGAGILSLRRPAEAMCELEAKEGADLIEIIKIIEKALKAAFTPQKMNYLMLMMVDPHIHYHVIPRYSQNVDFSNNQFKDSGWPRFPVLDAPSLSDEIMTAIKEHIISCL